MLITKLSSDAILEETPQRKVVDIAVPFYEGQDLAERFANAVGSKGKRKGLRLGERRRRSDANTTGRFLREPDW